VGRKARELRERLEWAEKYGKESTGIIVDLIAEFKRSGLFFSPPLQQRITRLKQASALWTAIQKSKEVFIP
jgi:hypothetical protein